MGRHRLEDKPSGETWGGPALTRYGARSPRRRSDAAAESTTPLPAVEQRQPRQPGQSGHPAARHPS